MRRREFILALGSAATWPLIARAQQPAMPVIGYLDPRSFDARREEIAALQRGLFENGFIDGRNVAIEYRWAEDRNDRLPALAAELVRRGVAVMIAYSTAAAEAAKAATSTIPIVFYIGADPVKLGLVASLSRPGRNVTGVTNLSNSVEVKKLELLHELVPKASLIAMLCNPTNPNTAIDANDVKAASLTSGVDLLILNASQPSEVDAAFERLMLQHAAGLVVASDTMLAGASDRLVALATHHRIPAIGNPSFTSAGGLMGYGSIGGDSFQLLGNYAGRILKGEKPDDLPVQQATKIGLIINLKTAKALGLAVPATLQARADKLIE
jgi:putative ABC transport system substrate-binding protein